MPQIIVCGDCGHILYRGVELKPPAEVIHHNAGICPKCGRKLLFDSGRVHITPVEE